METTVERWRVEVSFSDVMAAQRAWVAAHVAHAAADRERELAEDYVRMRRTWDIQREGTGGERREDGLPRQRRRL